MKKRINIIQGLLFVFLFIFTSQSNAESDNIAVYANATIYANPTYDSLVLVEFPFTLNRSDFEFYKPDSSDSRYFAKIFVQVDLLGVTGFTVDSTTTYFSLVVQSLEEASLKEYRIFNKLRLNIKPGIYSAHMTVIDVVSKAKGTFFIENINVKIPQSEKISISGTNLAYDITYVGEEGFEANPYTYKNGYKVLVNPISVFADTDSILHVYGEIYNLVYDEAMPSKYQLIINVLDNNNNLFKMYGSRLVTKAGTSSVFVQKLSIVDWPAGHYKLEIIAADLAAKTSDTVYLPVHTVSTEMVLATAKTISDFADPYDTLSLKVKSQMLKYLFNGEEEKIFASLGDVGKENYLNMYWKEHDLSPETEINEYRLDIINRYNYVNRRFSTNDVYSNGWLTDRARIYMRYGPWEERDDHEAPRIGNPFVIWHYYSLEGGLLFIFEDYFGDDDYRLVHSNGMGEIYNSEWDEKIKTGYFDFND